MKKTLCALLALLLALSVAACGKKVPTPSETVSAALDALKSGDMTAAAETWGGSISSYPARRWTRRRPRKWSWIP